MSWNFIMVEVNEPWNKCCRHVIVIMLASLISCIYTFQELGISDGWTGSVFSQFHPQIIYQQGGMYNELRKINPLWYSAELWQFLFVIGVNSNNLNPPQYHDRGKLSVSGLNWHPLPKVLARVEKLPIQKHKNRCSLKLQISWSTKVNFWHFAALDGMGSQTNTVAI